MKKTNKPSNIALSFLALPFLALPLLMCLYVFLVLSGCQESGTEETPTHIQGRIQLSTGLDFKFDGDLAKKGTDYLGYCVKDGDTFNFEIGSYANDHDSFEETADLFVHIEGINGPPQKGVFDNTGEAKTNQSYYTTFSFIQIVNTFYSLQDVNTYTFVVENREWTNECNVELWATPTNYELTPETKNKFEYYARINCSGMSVKASNIDNAILSSFNIEMYFSNC